MSIIDEIRKRIVRAGEVLFYPNVRPFFGAFTLSKHQFARLIWYNICDLLTDVIEDVQLSMQGNTSPLSDVGMRFAAFRVFVYTWGKQIMQRLYDEGFVVIGYDEASSRYWQMKTTEYTTISDDDVTAVRPVDPTVQVYVMKSATFLAYGKSDFAMCKGFLDFLDDVLNGSATVSRRLGSVVVASPKNLNNAPTATVLTDEQKKKLEKDIQDDYGTLSNQSNVMILPREMSWQVINLAGLDVRMQEKVKTAILAIVDRIKVPANQVAIIDAQSSKTLANGGEMREGDKLKYKSFRRLFERTFGDMARYYGLQIDYIIDGEPIGDTGEVRL